MPALMRTMDLAPGCCKPVLFGATNSDLLSCSGAWAPAMPALAHACCSECFAHLEDGDIPEDHLKVAGVERCRKLVLLSATNPDVLLSVGLMCWLRAGAGEQELFHGYKGENSRRTDEDEAKECGRAVWFRGRSSESTSTLNLHLYLTAMYPTKSISTTSISTSFPPRP